MSPLTFRAFRHYWRLISSSINETSIVVRKPGLAPIWLCCSRQRRGPVDHHDPLLASMYCYSSQARRASGNPAGYGRWVPMPFVTRRALQNVQRYACPSGAGGERFRQAQPLAISQAGYGSLLPLFLVADVATGSIKCDETRHCR